MRHPARAIALGTAVVLALLVAVFVTQIGDDPVAADRSNRLLGDPVPAFSVRTFDGDTFTDADLDGPVIINFWNSWCIPCRQELPALKEFFARHDGEPNFTFLGIVRDDTERAARKGAKADGMSWLLAFDPDSQAALAFGTRGQPETFAIDENGRIVGFQYGPSTVKDLEQLLARAQGRT